VGQRALLSIDLEIEGSGERVIKSDGSDVKWSTHRTFKGSVELAALKPETVSMVDAAGMRDFKPSENLQELQEESGECGEEDMACQMAAAMKMMQDPQMQELLQQGMSQAQAPARYQRWEVAANGGNARAEGSWQETWDCVFMTAVREERNCKLSAPTTGKPLDHDTLARGLQALNLELDTETGKSSLMLALAPSAEGEIACRERSGGPEILTNETRHVVFTVPIDGEISNWVPGTPSGSAIAQGELNFETPAEMHADHIAMMTIHAPLKIRLRWSMALL
jgi:hypothetical protein